MKPFAAPFRGLFWLLLPLLASCGPAAFPSVCDPTALPYQYRVVAGEDRYFATLLPMGAGNDQRDFFMSQEVSPLRSEKVLGDHPTGQVVTFERRNDALVAEELGLSFNDDEIRTVAARSPAGVTHFEHEGATYTLWSCEGILSDRFRRSFPAIFG